MTIQDELRAAEFVRLDGLGLHNPSPQMDHRSLVSVKSPWGYWSYSDSGAGKHYWIAYLPVPREVWVKISDGDIPELMTLLNRACPQGEREGLSVNLHECTASFKNIYWWLIEQQREELQKKEVA